MYNISTLKQTIIKRKESLSYTGPLRGSHDAEVAHGENEFDTPARQAQYNQHHQ